MRRLWPRTFFAQLVLGTVAVQTLLLGVFVSWVVVTQRDSARLRSLDRMQSQLSRLSTASAKALKLNDLAMLDDTLALAEIAPTIQATRLTDMSGKTIAVSRAGLGRGLDAAERAVLPTATQNRVFTLPNGQLEAVAPVMDDGRQVAVLWLEANTSLMLNTAVTISRIALSYGAFALLANLLPIFLLVRSMTRPLRVLRAATQRVLRDDGPDGAAFPLPVTSSNEAGLLTMDFNIMVAELEEQRSGLLETLALLDSMLANAPIGFAFFDETFRHVRLNGFYAAVSGRTIGAHLGERPLAIHRGTFAEGIEQRLAAVFDTGAAARDVELRADLDGLGNQQRTWLMSFYPVRAGTEAVRWVGVIVTDITERLQAEETLRKTEKLAAAGRLAASVAHEINNPLESVTNLLYILRQYDPMEVQAIEYIEMAQAELARVAEITQQTLRFYRQSVSRSQTNLAEVMDSIVTLYQPRMNASRVVVCKEFDRQAVLLCSAGEIRQLLANLIVNAVDAMPTGGTLTLRIRQGIGPAGDAGVHVAVADTGMGMSEATRRKIFEAFFTTKAATGTGLGLWVSDEIIRKHGGWVQVRSRQGVPSGTCFRMFFPASVEAEKPAVLESMQA